MTVRELREKYLAFFESKGHLRVPSGSLVPIDVTGRLDDSLLFNGAGMIQFKPYFRGVAQPENRRLTNAQKCVRTGDIEEVGDATHLTFFEMLGNFSFGDYFKAQAIAYSWEFLTSKEWLGLDPQRLSFTVFESDEEAVTEWSSWLIPAGLNPEARLMRLGEETNYWPAGAFSKGPPGPCGPNSEMFYWVSPDPVPGNDYTQADWERDEAAGKWVEIWNDVFIQYEWQGHLKDPANPKLGYEKDDMPELPFRSIDTGMGLERTAMVLAGGKSVYDSDVFEPIFGRLEDLRREALGDKYEPRSLRLEPAARIIADHIRTSVFCIADGVLPGNTGRGYVLRRLIRRAVLKGQRVLGFNEPFFHRVYEGVVESMGGHYTELVEKREVIIETLRNEESQFRRTLAAGSNLLQEELNRVENGVLAGDVAFRLYDTFGFPLEVTQELATEAGYEVDFAGYEQSLREAQARSRGGQEIKGAYEGLTEDVEYAFHDAPDFTDFVGYDSTEAGAWITRVKPTAEGARIAIEPTPFYAESGGQTGDKGVLILKDGPVLEVMNTVKSAGTFWHDVRLPEGVEPLEELVGKMVRAQVNSARRDRIRRNHTATHLLQAALRAVLGTHVTQAGSYVGPDNLRFDFTHSKGMTPDELERVERMVNEQALANTVVVTHANLPVAEAKARGAMALFGEKYGDKVRMVEIGEFSRELCGGIHVRSTGEVGLFKIVSESSAAGGVRRIEAITGEAAYEYVLEETRRVREAASLLKTSTRELVPAIERTLEAAKEERKRREKAEMAAMGGGGSKAETETIEIGPVVLWRRDFGEADPKLAASAVDNAAAEKPNQVTLAAVTSNGKPSFIAKVGPNAVTAGAHAGNLLREVAKIAGGGGGGRPDFATAGGKDATKVGEALEAAAKLLAGMVGVSPD
jgi:alanyl-tRNA synthetase